MSSNALASQGLDIQVGDGASPEVFTSISDVVEVTGPDGSAAEIDVTDLASTAKEFKRGLPDNGSVSFSLNFIPANVQHAQLRSDFNSQTEVARNYRIRFTDSPRTIWTFNAYVAQLSVSNPADDKTTASVSLRVKGAITES